MATRALVFAVLIVDALVLLLVAGSLPAFASAYGVPQDVAGLVFTANGLGFVAAVPLSGVLADRFGKRSVAAVSAAVLAFGLLLFAAGPSLAWGLGAAALIGAGAGSVEGGVTALLPELYPRREAFANNFAQAFFGAGAALGPLVLLVPWVGWRLRLALGGAAFLLIGGCLWRERHHDAPSAGRLDLGGWFGAMADVLRSPGVSAPLAALVLYTGVEVAVWGWLFAVVTRPDGAGAIWAVAELSGFWCAMGAGRLLIGVLSDRVPLPRLITVGTAAGVPALLLSLLAPSRAAALAAVVLCGLAFSGIWPSLVGHAQRRHGQSAFLAALLVAAGGAGALVVPAAFGFATAHLGLPAAAVGLAAVLAPVALLPWAEAQGLAPASR
jgi:fucose permease